MNTRMIDLSVEQTVFMLAAHDRVTFDIYVTKYVTKFNSLNNFTFLPVPNVILKENHDDLHRSDLCRAALGGIDSAQRNFSYFAPSANLLASFG